MKTSILTHSRSIRIDSLARMATLTNQPVIRHMLAGVSEGGMCKEFKNYSSYDADHFLASVLGDTWPFLQYGLQLRLYSRFLISRKLPMRMEISLSPPTNISQGLLRAFLLVLRVSFYLLTLFS
jgi:hypothetical protein